MTGQVCDRKRWVTDEGYRRDRKFHNTDCKTMQREPCFLCSLFHSKFIRQRSLSSSSTSLLFYLEGISIWTDSLSNMPEKNRRNDVHCIVLCPLAVGLAVGFPSLIPTPTLVFTTTSRARTQDHYPSQRFIDTRYFCLQLFCCPFTLSKISVHLAV